MDYRNDTGLNFARNIAPYRFTTVNEINDLGRKRKVARDPRVHASGAGSVRELERPAALLDDVEALEAGADFEAFRGHHHHPLAALVAGLEPHRLAFELDLERAHPLYELSRVHGRLAKVAVPSII